MGPRATCIDRTLTLQPVVIPAFFHGAGVMVYRYISSKPFYYQSELLIGVEYQFDGDKVNLAYAVEDIPESELNPVPQSVTMRHARLALLDLDLLSSIDEAINAMPEPDKTKAKIEWEYAAVVERNSDWVSDLGQQLGLSDVQIDDLFILAATK